MNTRERFQAVMNFKPFDRLPILEWAGWWGSTLERWWGEGLPKEITDGNAIRRHLGMDVYLQGWFGTRKQGCPGPASHGAGIIVNEADYDRVREFLYPWPVVDEKWWSTWAAEQEKGDVAVWYTVEGFFWFPRTLFGIEPHLYAFFDHPKLMHRINQDLAEWIIRVADALHKVCKPDFMTFAEDMSYNHGSMLSKQLFDEFMTPYYHQVMPALKRHGALTITDSDGDVTIPADWFAEAGLNGILPLERQAGVDVAVIRRNHPTMRFIGCFDKMTMNKGEAAMRAEFERLLPTAAGGGLIISCDHQTPPGVSYQDFQLYLRLFKEYAERAGKMSRDKK